MTLEEFKVLMEEDACIPNIPGTIRINAEVMAASREMVPKLLEAVEVLRACPTNWLYEMEPAWCEKRRIILDTLDNTTESSPESRDTPALPPPRPS